MARFFFIVTFLSFWPFLLYARSSIDVSQDSPIYRHIDQLIGHNLVKTAVIGHRPYSREEAARLTLEARRNWDEKIENGDVDERVKKKVESILHALKCDYALELESSAHKDKEFSFHPLNAIEFQFTFLDSSPRAFPVDNGAGSIAAFSNPMVRNRKGRDYVDGVQYSIESEHWADVTRYASFYFRPRFQFQFPDGNADSQKALVQELYGVFNFHNVELQVGRFGILEGQGVHGGLMLSDHARPLDHVQISNDHPIVLPWIFKYLGQNKFLVFFGTLGPESFFPNTYLAGYKWTIKPFPIWELGMANTMMIGGDGAPDFDAGNFFGDFVGFSVTREGKSNRIMGFDTRITLPFLRNTEVYGEAFWDDKTVESLKRTFVDSAAYYGGVYFPRLDNAGLFSGRLELKYLSEIFYRHGQFHGGYTLNGEILGDPLGPDGYGFYANFGWDVGPQTYVESDFSYETSDSDVYNNAGNTITVADDNPAEKRYRWLVKAAHRIKKNVLIKGTLGYERVANFNYLAENSKNNFMAEAGIEIAVGEFFDF